MMPAGRSVAPLIWLLLAAWGPPPGVRAQDTPVFVAPEELEGGCQYSETATSTCAAAGLVAIFDPEDCGRAVAYLDAGPDFHPTVEDSSLSTDSYPPGCYVWTQNNNKLYINVGTTNIRSCSTEYTCVCMTSACVDSAAPQTAAPATSEPTVAPTTLAPTAAPDTIGPTAVPATIAPTVVPTTLAPTGAPATLAPTDVPKTIAPTDVPKTIAPTDVPKTIAPTDVPKTIAPTDVPKTIAPTDVPKTIAPTDVPKTVAPTDVPKTIAPTDVPKTIAPTDVPKTIAPTDVPKTIAPTDVPKTMAPTDVPKTIAPTGVPETIAPTGVPTTLEPTGGPQTMAPTGVPATHAPTTVPAAAVTAAPSASPATDAPETAGPGPTNGTSPPRAPDDRTGAPDTQLPTNPAVTGAPQSAAPATTSTRAPDSDSPGVGAPPTKPPPVAGARLVWTYADDVKSETVAAVGIRVRIAASLATFDANNWRAEPRSILRFSTNNPMLSRGLQAALGRHELTLAVDRNNRTFVDFSIRFAEYRADMDETITFTLADDAVTGGTDILRAQGYMQAKVTVHHVEPPVSENVVAVSAVMSAAASAQQLALLMDVECGNGSRTKVPRSMHPLGVSIDHSDCFGALVWDTTIVTSAAIIQFLMALLAGYVVKFNSFLVPTHWLPVRTVRAAHGLVRFPGGLLFVFYFLYQGQAKCAWILTFDGGVHTVVGLFFMSLLIALPLWISWFLYNELKTRQARYREVDERHGKVFEFIMGKGEWVSRRRKNPVTFRFSLQLRAFTARCGWFLLLDFALMMVIGLGSAIPATSYQQCGHVRLALGLATVICLGVELYFQPHIRPRDNVFDCIRFMLQATGLFCQGRAYYAENITHPAMIAAAMIFLIAIFLLIVKLLMDIGCEVYIFLKRRRTILQKMEWAEFDYSDDEADQPGDGQGGHKCYELPSLGAKGSSVLEASEVPETRSWNGLKDEIANPLLDWDALKGEVNADVVSRQKSEDRTWLELVADANTEGSPSVAPGFRRPSGFSVSSPLAALVSSPAPSISIAASPSAQSPVNLPFVSRFPSAANSDGSDDDLAVTSPYVLSTPTEFPKPSRRHKIATTDPTSPFSRPNLTVAPRTLKVSGGIRRPSLQV
ncbi:Titin-like protein [Diplonema papillatum]|nr:Titin-like protein [Diplonema papillatum]